MYDFDAYRLYLRLIPWFLRKPIFSAWAQALSSALTFIQGLLLAFVNKTTYDLAFSAQIIYLEHVLNDTFDSDPLIYIDSVFLPSLYLYNTIEAQAPDYFRQASENDPTYMRNNYEYYSATQYIVHCSASLAGEILLITALIETYNLSGMNYEILFDL